ncbi:MAG TPA: hypothetical protein VJL87_01405, partial [Bdellovibrionota bacterium]|nr:hypothetical protein [Bdellovibrionota bacterium]
MKQRLLFIATAILLLSSCTKAPPPDKFGIVRAKLSNGVTVLIKEDHRQPLVAIETLVKTRETSLDEYRVGLRHI